MSENVLRVLLSELTTLRIVCRQCGAAVEVSVAALDRQHRSSHPQRGVEIRCPGCGQVVRSVSSSQPSPVDHFDQLATALVGLLSQPNVEFQFVLVPQEPKA